MKKTEEKKVEVSLVLKHQNPQLIPFMVQFTELLKNNEKFILGWKSGNKLYIFPVDKKTVNKNCFISLNKAMRHHDCNCVSIINYAVAIGTGIDISVSEEKITFSIFENEDCSKTFRILENLHADLLK